MTSGLLVLVGTLNPEPCPDQHGLPGWTCRPARGLHACKAVRLCGAVQVLLKGGNDDLVEIASMMAESVADLILLAPEEDRATLLAHVISTVGQMILEKSGAFEGGSSAAH